MVYYLYKEQWTEGINNDYLNNLELKYLDIHEIKLIEDLVPDFNFWVAFGRIISGDRCLTLRRDNEILSFAWISYKEANYRRTKFKLKENEAFLYYSWTFEEYRGMGYAEILRYKVYDMLRKQGRDTFYSFTDATNKSALRFKDKIGAVKLKKIFQLGKIHFTLKNYESK